MERMQATVDEVKLKLQAQLFCRLKQEEMESVREEHLRLSEGLGQTVGMLGSEEKISSLIDEYETIMTSIVSFRVL